MRNRAANLGEAHGKPLRVLDFILPAGLTPDGVAAELEKATPGVKLRATGGEAHGYVNTSTRADGSLYVSVHLYEHDCDGAGCACAHEGVKHVTAPAGVEDKVKAALADPKVVKLTEHPVFALTGDEGADRVALLAFFAGAKGDKPLGQAELDAVTVLDAMTRASDETLAEVAKIEPAKVALAREMRRKWALRDT